MGYTESFIKTGETSVRGGIVALNDVGKSTTLEKSVHLKLIENRYVFIGASYLLKTEFIYEESL